MENILLLRLYVCLLGTSVVSSLVLSCKFSQSNIEDDALNERRTDQQRSRLQCTEVCLRDERCRGIQFRRSECNITVQAVTASALGGRIRYYRFRCCELGTATASGMPSSRTSLHLRLTTAMPLTASLKLASTMLISKRLPSKSPPLLIPKAHFSTVLRQRNMSIASDIVAVSPPAMAEKTNAFGTQLTSISKTASTAPTETAVATTESPCALYNITVRTGTDRGAGTNSIVQLSLLGSQGNFTHELENVDGDDFESGCTDIFQFGDECIGEMVNMTLKVIPSGVSPAWQLEWIKVQITIFSENRPSHTTTYTADVNSWLAYTWNPFVPEPDERTLPFRKLPRSTKD